MKLGTHIPSGLLHRVYQNQGQGSIPPGVTSLDRFYNIPLVKNFVTDFSGAGKAVKLKLSTHMDSGLIHCVYRNQGQEPITSGCIMCTGIRGKGL